MQNIFTIEKIINLKQLLDSCSKISVIAHTSPDGDAIGSATALKLAFQKLFPEKEFRAFVPNKYPEFLNWIAEMAPVEVCGVTDSDKVAFIENSDLIFISDLNDLKRIDHLGNIVAKNEHAKIILIDHHVGTTIKADIAFNTTESSSTSLLVYLLLKELGATNCIDSDIASAIYAGLITDTGCFSYSFLNKELFYTAGELVEHGADPVKIHQKIYDTQTEYRLRLLGYLLSKKMVLIPEKHAAYISLTENEKNKFHYSTGDTEGVVNYPMGIKEISISALFTESDGYIKVSLRSQGNFDVNVLAREYFNGGGHVNASGGKFYGSIEDAITTYKKALEV